MYTTCKLCNRHSIWETKNQLCNFSIQGSALNVSLIIFFYSPMLNRILNSYQTRWIVNNCHHGLNFIVAKFWPRCADSVSLWTGLWSSGELGRGKSEKACRQTFGTLVSRHPLCIRSWCKFLLGSAGLCRHNLEHNPADPSSYWREHWLLTGLIDIGFSGRHVACVLITKWQ